MTDNRIIKQQGIRTIIIMITLFVIILVSVAAFGHGGKHTGAFTHLQALQKAAQLYDKLIDNGKLHQSWENGLEKVTISNRQKNNKIASAESTTIVVETREQLIRLMGIWGVQTEWKVPHLLPDVPAEEIALEHLESLAIKNRLDLASARQEVEVLAQALGITLDWRWIGKADVGISTERDTDGQWVTGPSLTLELPIFNQRQADIARLEARLHQGQKRLAAQAVNIRSEVRSLRSRLMKNGVKEFHLVVEPVGGRKPPSWFRSEPPAMSSLLPMMTGKGPFGNIEMGGMFTVVKVRDNLRSDDKDPGWYVHPKGTVAYRLA